MGAFMVETKWWFKAREFTNCNCAYGCPCQFNALPTHGNCKAVIGAEISEGVHGTTKLDGVRFAGVFAWPGPIHLGNGEAFPIVDSRASGAQREAILRILSGLDTEPGATIFNVFANTFAKVHPPVFADIDVQIDVDKRRAKMHVSGYIDQRGEPIVNPVTGAEFRGEIELPNGFEYLRAEIARGWAKAKGPIEFDLADSHGHFAYLHLSDTGVVH
jgi:hypothetical protein